MGKICTAVTVLVLKSRYSINTLSANSRLFTFINDTDLELKENVQKWKPEYIYIWSFKTHFNGQWLRCFYRALLVQGCFMNQLQTCTHICPQTKELTTSVTRQPSPLLWQQAVLVNTTLFRLFVYHKCKIWTGSVPRIETGYVSQHP